MTAQRRPPDPASPEPAPPEPQPTKRTHPTRPSAQASPAIGTPGEQDAEHGRAAQKWEYRVIVRELHNAFWTVEMTEEVADLGRRGWELVAAYPVDMEISIASPSTHRAIELRERWVFKRRL
jgi:hypothetical protein